MTESMTGAKSTRHWAEDALWFDIPPFASRGIQPALKFLDRVFGNFQSCKVDIVETDVVVNGDMGLVCTVQRVPEISSVRSASRRCSTLRSAVNAGSRLPSGGRTSLEQIADRVGYSSTNAFSAAFRRHIGLAPGLWRQQPSLK